MSEIVNVIMNWIARYYGDALFVVVAFVSYIYLFVYSKENRKRIIYPVLLICFVAINPILYKYIFYRIIYWRLFWMLPNSIVIAYAVVKMVRNSNKIEKIIVIGMLSCLIVFKGSNAFEHGGFVSMQNLYKISDDVIQVCDIMLNLDDSPRCIMPAPLYSEVRQYSGDIELMYGRNIEGYINSNIKQEFRDVHAELLKESPNYDYVLNVAKSNQFEFVVVESGKPISNDVLEVYKCTLISSSGGLNIYQFIK